MMSEFDQRSEDDDNRPTARSPTVWGAPARASDAISPGPAGVDAPSGPAVDPATGKPGKRMSTMAKTLTAVGVAAVIAVGGTVAITSATASTSTSTPGVGGGGQGGGPGGMAGGTTDPGAGTVGGGSRAGGFGEMAVIGNALHGEFVVADGTGTVTERIQTGAVTAVSSTSLTVKSTDDFSATYVVGSDVDVTTFTADTAVSVIAKVSGSSVTATSVTAARAGGGTGTGGTGTGGTGAIPGNPGSGSNGSGAPTV